MELDAADKANGMAYKGFVDINAGMMRTYRAADGRWDEWKRANSVVRFRVEYRPKSD